MSPNGFKTLSIIPQLTLGRLTLILKAFSKMEKVRKQAMDELGDSPLLLWQVESFLKIYPLDKEVSEKAIQLYIALLVMLEEIVSWFDHGICTSSSGSRGRSAPVVCVCVCFSPSSPLTREIRG